MKPDPVLLREFAAQRSESAFADLVQRHLALVYATARRRLAGDAHLAEEVAQDVFLALARKAPDLLRHPSLAGWLHVSTLHASAEAVRREQRRRQREAQAPTMSDASSPAPAEAELAELRPVLDDALLELSALEREAVIQRFFAQRSYGEIGEALQLSEDAARKRVDRSLEKLHEILLRRGVTTAGATLGGVLLAASAEFAPPAGLALRIAAPALAHLPAGGAAVATASTTLWAATAATVLTVGTLALWPQWRANDDLRERLAYLQEENRAIPQLEAETQRLAARPPSAPAAATAPTPAAPPPPAAPANLPPAASTRTVILSNEGTLQWDGKMITLDTFVANLAQHARSQGTDSTIFVRAGDRAYLSQLHYVVDEAAKAGIQHLVVESKARPEERFSGVWF